MKAHAVLALHFHTPDLFALDLDRGDVRFNPGDCVALFTPQGESRPYSIASGRDEPVLRFLIRRLPGGVVSGWLAGLRPGAEVAITAPFGWFRPGQEGGPDEPCVFIATGTGIAPFLSALRSDARLAPARVLLGVRQLADAIDLFYLSRRCDFRLAVSRELARPHRHGRVTDLLADLPLAACTHYYLCGLDAMIHEVSLWLEARGVPYTHINREIFFSTL